MNAAFVLMTAAWLSGQHAAPAPIPAPAHGHGAIAAPGYAGCGSDCWGGCDVQCERQGCLQKLLGRLRARRSSSCCADDCGCGYGHASYVSTGSCQGGSCGSSCGSSCYTASSDCCCQTSRHGFGHRMRGLFRRNQCCDYSAAYGCDCQGGYGYGHISPAPAPGAPGVIPGGPGVIPGGPGGVAPDATMPKAGEGAGAEQMPAPQPAPAPAPAPAPQAAPAPAGTGLTEPPVTNDIGIDNPVSGPIPLNEPNLNIVPPAVPAVPSNGSPVAPF